MDDFPNKNSFISGIHNYCDRWCERCQFTDRCRVFAMEQELTEDDDIESVVRTLTSVFADTKQMLIEEAEEIGIDPFAMSDEEFAEIRGREKAFVDGDELSQLAERYWRQAKEIIEGEIAKQDELVAEVLSVLGWYLFFIPVKVKCGLNGLLDHEGFEDKTQQEDAQSYANGTVKISLIAIERSISAWHQMAEVGHAYSVNPVIDILETIKTELETRFPLARDFIRPGFDEIEIIM